MSSSSTPAVSAPSPSPPGIGSTRGLPVEMGPTGPGDWVAHPASAKNCYVSRRTGLSRCLELHRQSFHLGSSPQERKGRPKYVVLIMHGNMPPCALFWVSVGSIPQYNADTIRRMHLHSKLWLRIDSALWKRTFYQPTVKVLPREWFYSLSWGGLRPLRPLPVVHRFFFNLKQLRPLGPATRRKNERKRGREPHPHICTK